MKRAALLLVALAACRHGIVPEGAGPLVDLRDARESAVVKDISRFFGEQGVLLPASATACLSTPMGEADIALIADVFERYLAVRADSYAGLRR